MRHKKILSEFAGDDLAPPLKLTVKAAKLFSSKFQMSSTSPSNP